MDSLAAKSIELQPPCAAGAFAFQDAGPLRDGELELVEPHQHWIDAVMQAVQHPITQRSGEECATITRQSLLKFVQAAPLGREPADANRGHVPVYHFWLRLRPQFGPPVPMAGAISLRIASTPDIQMYFGHFGYGVYPPARGRHLAERACRLLLPLAARHGLNPVWITTDPENTASRRTCERLGAQLVEIVPVPSDHVIHQRGHPRKCRYRLCLDSPADFSTPTSAGRIPGRP